MLVITACPFMIMYVDLDVDVDVDVKTKLLCIDLAGRGQQTNNRTSTPPTQILAKLLNHLYRPCLLPFPRLQS